MSEVVIKIENLKKQYKIGQIGGTTLTADLQSWWAKKRGKEDPNIPLNVDQRLVGQTFMALNGINLEIRKGEAVGIIGMNGAGKSTLLKILARITAPTEGTAKLKGRVTSMLEVGTGFSGELTGRENIFMNGAILGMTKAEINSKIDQIIEFSECGDFIDTPVKRYSSGMYVKLAFSVAAHLDSEIMIMDEVLAVGDVKFQNKCLGKMGDAAEYDGKTVLYVSHNMATIRQLCTRCIVLKEGKIIFDGGVEDAINVYIENNTNKFIPYIDLTACKRPSPQHGQNIKITSINFEGNSNGIYSAETPLIFTISCTSNLDKDNLYLRLMANYVDSTPAGMSESQCLGSLSKGENAKFTFTFDVKNLAEGKYILSIDLYTKDATGGHLSYDAPIQDFPIEVERTSVTSLRWQHKYWGHTRFDDMKASRVE
ncbi:MAG: ABC transporter ATP-binding protein [Oscillospiraceae bacterium]